MESEFWLFLIKIDNRTIILYFIRKRMNIGNFNINFIEKLTVRDYQQISRLNTKFENKEIDEIELGNQLALFVIADINGEKDKEKILNLILDIDNIEDYSLLNETVAKKIDELVNPTKKKS